MLSRLWWRDQANFWKLLCALGGLILLASSVPMQHVVARGWPHPQIIGGVAALLFAYGLHRCREWARWVGYGIVAFGATIPLSWIRAEGWTLFNIASLAAFAWFGWSIHVLPITIVERLARAVPSPGEPETTPRFLRLSSNGAPPASAMSSKVCSSRSKPWPRRSGNAWRTRRPRPPQGARGSRLAEVDRAFVASFAERVRELFPSCPPGREQAISEHACRKYSGRVGRSAAAKRLDDEAVQMAVTAHVRHSETNYDQLLGRGYDRADARHEVRDKVQVVLAKWSRSAQPSAEL